VAAPPPCGAAVWLVPQPRGGLGSKCELARSFAKCAFANPTQYGSIRLNNEAQARVGARSMKIRFACLLATALAGVSSVSLAQQPAPAGDAFVEGQHYTRIAPAQPTVTDDAKVEVAEVFMYSCPACYSLEPHLQRWVAEKPENVTFVRIPASFNAVAKMHAQAFYTAQALGKVEEIDAPFFEEFHQKRNMLDTEAKLAEFFARFGVDKETFTKTFNSFAVHTNVQRADELVRRYRVSGTPAIVVEGKYMTSGSMAGSYEGWFAIVNHLAEIEKAP
jgi:thiol:disulfide interchange protein DsbA